MRTLASATLIFESIIVGLAALVSVFGPNGNGGINATTIVLIATAALAVVTPAFLRHQWGFYLGWVVQVGAFVGGLLLQNGSLLIVGFVFGLLYFFSLRLGRRGDAARAAYLAAAADGESSDTTEQGSAAPPVD
jgi:hypothetical protein